MLQITSSSIWFVSDKRKIGLVFGGAGALTFSERYGYVRVYKIFPGVRLKIES